ncbi:sigma-70 family RNA polymerase sigma factor [Amycolatopsis sp. NPDC051045]|uniref:RNA polymerase sigma factor n=1 Tax=Amycolatopsis sp. NPDC051045 TaxID=3156922 RepID=UPI00343F96A8
MTKHTADGEAAPDTDDRPDLGAPDAVRTFGLLYDRHALALHRYLGRRVGGAADDLVADTFLVAMQQRARYDPARGTARAWLYGIATNLLRGHVREEARILHASARADAGRTGQGDTHDGRVADMVDAQVRTRRLAEAIAGLDPGNRDVLLLSSWAALDVAEIAEALDIPVATVRTRLHRTRRRLQAHIRSADAISARRARGGKTR